MSVVNQDAASDGYAQFIPGPDTSSWDDSGTTLLYTYGQGTEDQPAMLFTGLSIPEGSTINSATLRLRLTSFSGGPTSFLQARPALEDSLSPSLPADYAGFVGKSWLYGSAETLRTNPSGGTDEDIDFSEVLSALVASLTTGQSVTSVLAALIYLESMSGSAGYTFAAVDHSTAPAPQLIVNFTAPGGGGVASAKSVMLSALKSPIGRALK